MIAAAILTLILGASGRPMFVWRGPYESRETAKRAGLMWHDPSRCTYPGCDMCATGRLKGWWTPFHDRALANKFAQRYRAALVARQQKEVSK